MSEGIKHDGGKPPLYLLPPRPLYEIAAVLAYGAEKYETKIPIDGQAQKELVKFCTCASTTKQPCATPNGGTPLEDSATRAIKPDTQRLSVQNAIKTVWPLLKGFAEYATIGYLKKQIRGTLKDNILTQFNGRRIIKNDCVNPTRSITPERKLKLDIKMGQEGELSRRSDLQKPMQTISLKTKMESVSFVEDRQEVDPLMSTTVIQRGNLEDLSVQDATKDLDFSEIARNLLKEHSYTCAVRKFEVKDNHFILSGAFNWAKGFKASRLFAALLRHLWAWWAGEDNDRETGLSHLAHAGCCLLFLMDLRHTRLEDDRPIGEIAPVEDT